MFFNDTEISASDEKAYLTSRSFGSPTRRPEGALDRNITSLDFLLTFRHGSGLNEKESQLYKERNEQAYQHMQKYAPDTYKPSNLLKEDHLSDVATKMMNSLNKASGDAGLHRLFVNDATNDGNITYKDLLKTCRFVRSGLTSADVHSIATRMDLAHDTGLIPINKIHSTLEKISSGQIYDDHRMSHSLDHTNFEGTARTLTSRQMKHQLDTSSTGKSRSGEKSLAMQLKGRYYWLRNCFELLDLSKSGQVNAAEFAQGISNAGINMDPQHVQSVFDLHSRAGIADSIQEVNAWAHLTEQGKTGSLGVEGENSLDKATSVLKAATLKKTGKEKGLLDFKDFIDSLEAKYTSPLYAEYFDQLGVSYAHKHDLLRAKKKILRVTGGSLDDQALVARKFLNKAEANGTVGIHLKDFHEVLTDMNCNLSANEENALMKDLSLNPDSEIDPFELSKKICKDIEIHEQEEHLRSSGRKERHKGYNDTYRTNPVLLHVYGADRDPLDRAKMFRQEGLRWAKLQQHVADHWDQLLSAFRRCAYVKQKQKERDSKPDIIAGMASDTASVRSATTMDSNGSIKSGSTVQCETVVDVDNVMDYMGLLGFPLGQEDRQRLKRHLANKGRCEEETKDGSSGDVNDKHGGKISLPPTLQMMSKVMTTTSNDNSIISYNNNVNNLVHSPVKSVHSTPVPLRTAVESSQPTPSEGETMETVIAKGSTAMDTMIEPLDKTATTVTSYDNISDTTSIVPSVASTITDNKDALLVRVDDFCDTIGIQYVDGKAVRKSDTYDATIVHGEAMMGDTGIFRSSHRSSGHNKNYASHMLHPDVMKYMHRMLRRRRCKAPEPKEDRTRGRAHLPHQRSSEKESLDIVLGKRPCPKNIEKVNASHDRIFEPHKITNTDISANHVLKHIEHDDNVVSNAAVYSVSELDGRNYQELHQTPERNFGKKMFISHPMPAATRSQIYGFGVIGTPASPQFKSPIKYRPSTVPANVFRMGMTLPAKDHLDLDWGQSQGKSRSLRSPTSPEKTTPRLNGSGEKGKKTKDGISSGGSVVSTGGVSTSSLLGNSVTKERRFDPPKFRNERMMQLPTARMSQAPLMMDLAAKNNSPDQAGQGDSPSGKSIDIVQEPRTDSAYTSPDFGAFPLSIEGETHVDDSFVSGASMAASSMTGSVGGLSYEYDNQYVASPSSNRLNGPPPPHLPRERPPKGTTGPRSLRAGHGAGRLNINRNGSHYDSRYIMKGKLTRENLHRKIGGVS